MSKFKYDVFLSFRGVDDHRGTFGDHLYHALHQAGLRPFLDSEAVEKGEEDINKLLERIENSEIFIPIFSKRFAESKSCLREIEKMVRNNANVDKYAERLILPVFYGVKSMDVRSFKDAVEKHETDEGLDKEIINEWQEALITASELPGYEIEISEDGLQEEKIVEEIVQRVLKELKSVPLNVTEHPIGIETHMKETLKQLQVGRNDVRMLIICGMDGLGKTTLAKAIYNKIHLKFESSSFISNIREMADQGAMGTLQNQLIHDISNGDGRLVQDPSHGVTVLKSVLQNKRVLLILDDVNDAEQIHELAGCQSWFHPGSRIILTARDDEHKINHTNWSDPSIYVHKRLENHRALQLFCLHAFRREKPDEGFDQLSREMTSAIDGVPLAIEVLGSALYGLEDKNVWKEMIAFLKKIHDEDQIHRKLRIGFNYLNQNAKAILLDIACFFNGFDKETAIFVWETCNLCPRNSIRALRQKSLIKVTPDGKLEMHGLLLDMGRKIAQQESGNEEKRSRLWERREITTLLKHRAGTSLIEGININSHECDDRIVETDGFDPMDKLRLLAINQLNLNGDYKKMPRDLNWLEWSGCPLESIPHDFDITQVAALDLSGSNISKLPTDKVFTNLKVLCLSSCNQLITTPLFSAFPCLVKVFLDHCQSLVMVDESIGELKNLIFLNLVNCTNMQMLPESISRLVSLKMLNFTCCSQLKRLPDCFREFKSLEELYAANCITMEELPNSIFEAPSLKVLDVSGCSSLERLPNGLPESSPLEFLNISLCSRLKELPESLSKSGSMKILHMEGCPSWKEHHLLNMQNLETFSLSNSSLKRLQTGFFDYLKKLLRLLLHMCAFTELPDSLGSLQNLQLLSIEYSLLKKLPQSIGSLQKLRKLRVTGCGWFAELPESIGNLQSLSELLLRGTSMTELPDSIGKLTNLEVLDLAYCTKLAVLPNSIGGLANLRELVLDATDISELPNSSTLTHLEVLSVRRCGKLLRLPEWVQEMEDLHTIEETGDNPFSTLNEYLVDMAKGSGRVTHPSVWPIPLDMSLKRSLMKPGWIRFPNPSVCYAGTRVENWDFGQLENFDPADHNFLTMIAELESHVSCYTVHPSDQTPLFQDIPSKLLLSDENTDIHEPTTVQTFSDQCYEFAEMPEKIRHNLRYNPAGTRTAEGIPVDVQSPSPLESDLSTTIEAQILSVIDMGEYLDNFHDYLTEKVNCGISQAVIQSAREPNLLMVVQDALKSQEVIDFLIIHLFDLFTVTRSFEEFDTRGMVCNMLCNDLFRETFRESSAIFDLETLIQTLIDFFSDYFANMIHEMSGKFLRGVSIQVSPPAGDQESRSLSSENNNRVTFPIPPVSEDPRSSEWFLSPYPSSSFALCSSEERFRAVQKKIFDSVNLKKLLCNFHTFLVGKVIREIACISSADQPGGELNKLFLFRQILQSALGREDTTDFLVCQILKLFVPLEAADEVSEPREVIRKALHSNDILQHVSKCVNIEDESRVEQLVDEHLHCFSQFLIKEVLPSLAPVLLLSIRNMMM